MAILAFDLPLRSSTNHGAIEARALFHSPESQGCWAPAEAERRGVKAEGSNLPKNRQLVSPLEGLAGSEVRAISAKSGIWSDQVEYAGGCPAKIIP
jgi:hypothetical protein